MNHPRFSQFLNLQPRKKLLSIILILLCASSIVDAKPVSIDSVQKVGQSKVTYEEKKSERLAASGRVGVQSASYRGHSIKQVREVTDTTTGKVLAYVMDLNPKGYVVVSPDTDITPVIAYSFESDFVMEDSRDNVLLHLVSWDMANRIEAIPVTSQEIKDSNSSLWDKYLNNSLPVGQISSDSGPHLLPHPTWDQRAPYNNLCPEDPVTHTNSVTGCVATAMAQIVNFWGYPSAVTFVAGYDNDDYITTTRGIPVSATTANFSNITYPITSDYQKAELSRACGVATKMDYSSEVSGTNTAYVAAALKNKFGYHSADWKSSGELDFYSTIQANIQKGQPVQIAIGKSADLLNYTNGHSIVSDGYDNGEYHLNLGWGGDKDSWYALSADLPTIKSCGNPPSPCFNAVRGAVVNILPPQLPPSITTLNPTSSSNGGLVIISGSNFGSVQGEGSVKFNNNQSATIVSWSDTVIQCKIPPVAATGNITVTTRGGTSNAALFTVGYPQSPHSYPIITDFTSIYRLSGTPSAINVTFDALTYVLPGLASVYPGDKIYVMDGSGVNIPGSPFTGSALAGQTKQISGATVQVRLASSLSAGSGAYWGFKVTNITAANTTLPTITSQLSASGTVGTFFSYQIAAANSPTSFSATNLPAGLSINTSNGVISGTPTSAVTKSVTITATNSAGMGTDMLVLTIYPQPDPSAAVVNSVSPNPVTGSSSAQPFIINGSNFAPNCNVTLREVGGGTYPDRTIYSFSSTSITLKPTFGNNAATWTVEVGNPGTQTSVPYSFNVISPGSPATPSITSQSTASGKVGEYFTYQIAATNSPTGYGATNLPSGLGINTATGLISGTPTSNSAGGYWVSLSATNSAGPGNAGLMLTIAANVINHAPYQPGSPEPSGGSSQFTSTTLSWSGGDPDGDNVTYDVYLNANATPNTLVASGLSGTAIARNGLGYNTHYYWRVVATDAHGLQTSGPVWDFWTVPPANNSPYKPSTPSPYIGASNQPTTLTLGWSGGDPEGDAVWYDVYLDANPNPTTVIQHQSTTSRAVSGLLTNTHYYWKVVAMNSLGQQIVSGDIWDFWTGSATNINYLPPVKIDGTLSGQGVIRDPSVASDRNGILHLAYYSGAGDLKYTKQNGSAWTLPFVIEAAVGGYIHPSIAIDALGNPHIFYSKTSGPEKTVKYAKWNGVLWSTSTIDTTSSNPDINQMVVDGAGNPHVVYNGSDGGVSSVKYGKHNGVTWSTYTVAGTNSFFPRLALSSKGEPYVAYWDYSTKEVKLSTWTGAGFSFAPVAIASMLGGSFDFALDGDNRPQVLYTKNYANLTDLMYRRWDGNAWTTPEIVAPGIVYPKAFQLDGAGVPHVYIQNTGDGISRYYKNGASWTSETIDGAGGTGGNGLAVAFDLLGRQQVAYVYQDASNNFNLLSTQWTGAGYPQVLGGNNRGKLLMPTGFNGTRSGTSINWTWADNSPNETGFRLYGSTNPSGPFSLIADTNLLGPGNTSFNETSLPTGFTYYRYVAGVNQGSFVTSALSGVYIPAPSTLQLSVAKAGSGSGAVTSSAGGIDCGFTCSASYVAATSVTLTAAAAGGSTFAGWSGADCSGTGTCVVAMSSAQSVTATFSANPYLLSVYKNGTGVGSVISSVGEINCGPTCMAGYTADTPVTLTAPTASGSAFAGWSGPGCSGTGACTVTMNASWAVFATFNLTATINADTVLGQPDAQSSNFNVVTIDKFSRPAGVFNNDSSSGKVWVVDSNNNRVLGIQGWSGNGTSASVVIGQPDFISGIANRGGNAGANTLKQPCGVAESVISGQTYVWVADCGNNRVLRFKNPPNTGASADIVLGQANFVSTMTNRGGSIAANTLNFYLGGGSINGVAVNAATGDVWVVDNGNNRILKYNVGGHASGMNADLVLGKGLFTDDYCGAYSDTCMPHPTGITVDRNTGNVWVVESGGSRVLRFLSPSSNGASADIVLGQADFASNSSNRGGAVAANTLFYPAGVSIAPNGSWLAVADTYNNRVLKYVSPFTTGQNAAYVIGQLDFASGGSIDSTLTARSVGNPASVHISGANSGYSAWVVSRDRVLRFDNPTTNAPNAVEVMGASDFTRATRNSVESKGFSYPVGVVYDPKYSRVFVADSANNRVLWWNKATPLYTQRPADGVLGQVNFTEYTAAAAQNRLASPAGLAVDTSGNLYVAEEQNHRVLRFQGASLATGMNADLVLGQANFTSNSINRGLAAAANSLKYPYGVGVDRHGNIWVADGGNNRVLKFSSASLVNGADPNLVLGQADFTATASNRGGSIAANTLSWPRGVHVDSSDRVWVADDANSRVIKFDAPSVNGQPANLVLGAPNLNIGGWDGDNASQNALDRPWTVAVDVFGNIWVSDSDNHRVVKYAPPFSTGMPATAVIGQANFTSGAANGGGGAAANNLNSPAAVAFDNLANLYVTDRLNNRVTMYNSGLSATALNPYLSARGTTDLTFTWDTVSGADYVTSLFEYPSYTNLVAGSSATQSGNSKTFTGLALGATYYFTVKLSAETDVGYSVNRVSTVTLTAPEIDIWPPSAVSPSSGTFTNSATPAMTWTTLLGGAHRIQLATTPDFTNIIADSTTANQFYVSTNALNTGSIYWWRIRNSLSYGRWASTSSFTVDLAKPDFSSFQVSVNGNEWVDLPLTVARSTPSFSARVTVQDPASGLMVSTVSSGGGKPYSVLYSTDSGVTWRYVSTASIVMSGTNGTNSAQTLAASNIPIAISTGPSAQNNQLAFVAADYAGSVSTAVYVIVIATKPPLLEALDAPTFIWLTSENTEWAGQSAVSIYGGSAVQSGRIADSQSSYLQTTITGPGELTFYWKVSSELNWDYLKFYIDSAPIAAISGSTEWEQIRYPGIPAGQHTLKWEYAKDDRGSTGADAGWLDKVELFHTTQLEPTATQVSSYSITTAWTPVAGVNYTVVLSTDQSYSAILSSLPLTTNTTIFSGLSSDTTYYFEVKITTEVDSAFLSNHFAIQTLPPPPSSPDSFWGAPRDPGVIQWLWTDISSEIGYMVLSSTGGVLSGNLAANTTYWTEMGLSTNTAYSRSILAYNIGGESALVSASTYTLAAAPAAAAVSSLAITGLTANWTANSNPDGTIYIAELSSNSFISYVSSQTAGLTAAYSSLTPNTIYSLRVKAVNFNGAPTGYVALGSTVTLANPPSGAAATAIYVTSATINWALNGNPALTDARLERSTESTTFTSVYDGTLLQYIDQNLQGCTTYYYRVRNLNHAGVPTVYNTVAQFITQGSTPSAPGNLYAESLGGNRIALTWEHSPFRDMKEYRLYYDNGTGVMDYATPLAVVSSTVTTYATTALASGMTYKFGLRAKSRCGLEDGNVAVLASAASLNSLTGVRAAIKIPQTGKKVDGNRVTVMAELTLGDSAQTREVLFQYKASTDTAWTNIPAANPNHQNPAPKFPYMMQWDVSNLFPTNYDLRAVTTDMQGSADSTPPAVTVSVDSIDPDINEMSLGGGATSKDQKINNTVDNTLQTAAEDSGQLTKLRIPAGALSQSTVTVTVTNNPVSSPVVPDSVQPCGVLTEVVLSNGQTQLSGGLMATITLSFPDENGDGIVDGTVVRANTLVMHSAESLAGPWQRDSSSSVDLSKRIVTGLTPHFSFFALFAPLAANLDSIEVYPVPFRPNDGNPDTGAAYSAGNPNSGILFDNLPTSVSVKIYTVTGQLVAEFGSTASSGKLQWDVKNKNGKEVATGVYMAVISSPGTKTITKKVVVLR